MQRRDPRFPLKIEVAFRTHGAFLVAYSLNLSKGGVFLATETQLPEGTALTLRLVVPGYIATIRGEVAWVRGGDDAGPPGLGIRFTDVAEEQLGVVIDAIAARFRGLRLLVYAGKRAARTQLSGLARAVLGTAVLVEATTPRELEHALSGAAELDLAIVDVDGAPAGALRAIRAWRLGRGATVPTIAVAADDLQRKRVEELRPEGVLDGPPTSGDFQEAVLELIARPRVVDGAASTPPVRATSPTDLG